MYSRAPICPTYPRFFGDWVAINWVSVAIFLATSCNKWRLLYLLRPVKISRPKLHLLWPVAKNIATASPFIATSRQKYCDWVSIFYDQSSKILQPSLNLLRLVAKNIATRSQFIATESQFIAAESQFIATGRKKYCDWASIYSDSVAKNIARKFWSYDRSNQQHKKSSVSISMNTSVHDIFMRTWHVCIFVNFKH
jgi:hypothetical protein